MGKLFDLEGRVALITGGNGGIGLGFARGIVDAGGSVCIWGTNEEKNASALEELRALSPNVAAMKCDVSQRSEVDACFTETLKRFGRVDGCFANAGVGARGTAFHDQPDEDWQRVLGVNLYGAVYVLQASARHMVERANNGDPFGRLVSTASLAAISGQARGEHYAASKGALDSMTKALAVEYARYGITAHTVLPGWIATAMTEQTFAWDKFHDNVMPRIPMRRWGEPEDFSGIAVYIMSQASSYHTSETFLIDGGYFVY